MTFLAFDTLKFDQRKAKLMTAAGVHVLKYIM